MKSTKVPTLEESTRRIDAAIAGMDSTPWPRPPGPGERVASRITVRQGADTLVTEAIERDASPPEPGSLEESEVRIAAALAGQPYRPAPAPATDRSTDGTPAITDDASFWRSLNEAKRRVDGIAARLDRTRGGGSRPAGTGVELREPAGNGRPVPSLEESERRIDAALL